MNKKMHYETFYSVKRPNETFSSNDTCEEYVTYISKIEENMLYNTKKYAS